MRRTAQFTGIISKHETEEMERKKKEGNNKKKYQLLGIHLFVTRPSVVREHLVMTNIAIYFFILSIWQKQLK